MLALRTLIVVASSLGLAACGQAPEPSEPVEVTSELLRRAKRVEFDGLAAMVPDALIYNKPVKRFVSLASNDDLVLCGEIDGQRFIWSSRDASGTSDAQDEEWAQACARPIVPQPRGKVSQPS